jgi:hypothetical protein
MNRLSSAAEDPMGERDDDMPHGMQAWDHAPSAPCPTRSTPAGHTSCCKADAWRQILRYGVSRAATPASPRSRRGAAGCAPA